VTSLPLRTLHCALNNSVDRYSHGRSCDNGEVFISTKTEQCFKVVQPNVLEFKIFCVAFLSGKEDGSWRLGVHAHPWRVIMTQCAALAGAARAGIIHRLICRMPHDKSPLSIWHQYHTINISRAIAAGRQRSVRGRYRWIFAAKNSSVACAPERRINATLVIFAYRAMYRVSHWSPSFHGRFLRRHYESTAQLCTCTGWANKVRPQTRGHNSVES